MKGKKVSVWYAVSTFVLIVALIAVVLFFMYCPKNSNIIEAKNAHKEVIVKQNDNTDNDYKIIAETDRTTEEAYLAMVTSIEEGYELLDYFATSSEKCEDDLYELFDKLKLDKNIISRVPYYENPFISRDWLTINIATTNWRSLTQMNLLQMKIAMYELLCAQDDSYEAKYKAALKEFEEYHESLSYVD